MIPTALVVTTVHRADDPRIRERTIGSLSSAFTVRFAAQGPPPNRSGDHQWVRLRGGRIRRWFGALRQMMRTDVAVVSVHDPELIPAALVARLLRRVPFVFDVHEDVPAQIRTKGWVPRALRPLAAWAAVRALRAAERFGTVTLAEPGYRHLFRSDHAVFPNYPPAHQLPDPAPDGGYLVYVGDITEARGAIDMVDAVAAVPDRPRLRLVGRCAPDLRHRLFDRAAAAGVALSIEGPLPHRAAMEVLAGASAAFSLLHDIPNYRHSMPTKLLEYLAMGVPAIVTNLPGTTSALEPGMAVVVVEPADPRGAALGVRSVVEARMRLTAQEQVEMIRARFTWPGDDVASAYRAVAGLA